MYEFQVDHARLKSSDLPDDIKKKFKDPDAELVAIALIPWAEHCTECAMPQCYQTCDLYESRKDGKCRCFSNGISPIANIPNCQNYVVKISFKRSACLMAYSNPHMVSIDLAKTIEKFFLCADNIISVIPDKKLSIMGRRGITSRIMTRIKHFIANKGVFANNSLYKPDYFLVEVYNGNSSNVNLTLTIRNPHGERREFPYQKRLSLQSGFNRFKIPYNDIVNTINIKELMTITFNPNINSKEDDGLTLYFGLLTFVSDSKYSYSIEHKECPKSNKRINNEATKTRKIIKILVWDLDNTIWNGILVEDGPDNISLKSQIKDIIREMDRRGIVNSVVSKNNPEQALKQIERFGLKEFIVFPKIGWGPKGEAVKELIKEFNIGEDTVAFIDDSPFEREQVQITNPKIRVFSDKNYLELLNLPEFNPPVTAESSKRRFFYQSQGERKRAQASFSGEYFKFIKSCSIQININPVRPENLDRIHELVQRTNQLNFSGNLYTREKLIDITQNGKFDHYCVDCNDKFGDYGIVGFAVVDKKIPRLIDLMFSCRVQAKRVEHAFMIFLLQYYRNLKYKVFEAEYLKTERNKQAGEVFKDLGFQEKEYSNGKYLFQFDLNRALPENDIITISWQTNKINL